MVFLEDTEIFRVLRGLNPWWATGFVPEGLTKPLKRIAFHQILRLLEDPSFRRGIVLSGPRRVGKTTILYQLCDHYLRQGVPRTSIIYLTLDHPILKLTSLDKILEIIAKNVSIGDEKLTLFLDEIQYAEDWSGWLKQIIDRHPNYRVVATGSAAGLLLKGGRESGVGRWIDIKIPTLSFYEYLILQDIPRPDFPLVQKRSDLAELAMKEFRAALSAAAPLETHFHRYLLQGGFPETALMNDLSLAHRFLREDVVDKVIKRDMASLYGVRNLLELERLFIYLCLHSGGILNQTTIAKELGTTAVTVANHLRLLEDAHLIYRVEPFPLTGKKGLKPRPKIYLADPSLRNAVLMRGEEVLTDSREMGLIVEATVLKHLYSYYFPKKISYWRIPGGRGGVEVDFVLHMPQGPSLAWEVKYQSRTAIGPSEGIVRWGREMKGSINWVLTKDIEDYEVVKVSEAEIMKMPTFMHLFVLGHIEFHEASLQP